MKEFKRLAAQGDVILRKIDKLPDGVVEMSSRDGEYVVAHSETGHHHVITADKVRAFRPKKPDIYQMFLQIDEPTDLVHERSFDTHEALRIQPGTYEVRRQRQYTPKGFRPVVD